MKKLIQNLSRLTHQREFRIYGARRSGNHAILNWICANAMDAGESICFLNDLNHNYPPNDHTLSGISLPSAPPKIQVPARDGPDLLIASFEEDGALEMAHALETGRQDYELIWIRRDPAEVFASRIARVEKLPSAKREGQKWEFDMVKKNTEGRFQLLEIWDSFHPIPKNALIIHYELWNGSPRYRSHLASRLRIGKNDLGKSEVPGWGFGPSFKKPPSAGELRYPHFADHPLMIEFMKQLTHDN